MHYKAWACIEMGGGGGGGGRDSHLTVFNIIFQELDIKTKNQNDRSRVTNVQAVEVNPIKWL